MESWIVLITLILSKFISTGLADKTANAISDVYANYSDVLAALAREYAAVLLK